MTKWFSSQAAPCEINLTDTVYIRKHIYKRKNRKQKEKQKRQYKSYINLGQIEKRNLRGNSRSKSRINSSLEIFFH